MSYGNGLLLAASWYSVTGWEESRWLGNKYGGAIVAVSHIYRPSYPHNSYLEDLSSAFSWLSQM